MPAPGSGRHPKAQVTVVRLTEDATEDLARLLRKGDPQVVRWALKKMIHLEKNPEAGEALLGGLMGWRKLTVGDRDWRLVWRVTHSDSGGTTIDIAVVWAFGARAEQEVYGEMEDRVAAAGSSPVTLALSEVLATLGKVAKGLEATTEPDATEPMPKWLRQALIHVVHTPAASVDEMTEDEAMEVWNTFITGSGR